MYVSASFSNPCPADHPCAPPEYSSTSTVFTVPTRKLGGDEQGYLVRKKEIVKVGVMKITGN